MKLGTKYGPNFFLWSKNLLELPVELPRGPAWPSDFELLGRVSELKFDREKMTRNLDIICF